MPVHDDYLLAAVTRHLIGSFLQQFELQMGAVGNSPWLVLRFEDLSEIVFGKHDGIFLLSSVQCGVADVEQVGAERQVCAVLFQDAKRQDASASGLVDGLHEIGASELFPVKR